MVSSVQSLSTGDPWLQWYIASRNLKYWPLFRTQGTFLVTEDPSRAQGRARREVLSPLRFEPYEAVALASGGEVIFTEDQYIQDVAAIVGDSIADLVSMCGGSAEN